MTFPILNIIVGCTIFSLAMDKLMKLKKTKITPGDKIAKIIDLCLY